MLLLILMGLLAVNGDGSNKCDYDLDVNYNNHQRLRRWLHSVNDQNFLSETPDLQLKRKCDDKGEILSSFLSIRIFSN